MIHFQLPKNSPLLYKYITYVGTSEHKPTATISNSLSYYLNDIKKRIDTKETQWDITKRYTNPCEYIHTTIPGKKRSVAKKNLYHDLILR